jgi:hypothetical protein
MEKKGEMSGLILPEKDISLVVPTSIYLISS